MLKQGSLEKLAGAKKGSEKAKQHWQQRWFVLSTDDLDGDGVPDVGMYQHCPQIITTKTPQLR